MAEMTAAEAAEWGKTLDFPTVWATIIKMGEKVDKAAEAVDKLTEKHNRTDEGLNKTEERLNKTDEGLNKTEGRLNKTEEILKEMAESAKKTEENLNKTEEGLKKTEEILKEMAESAKKTEEGLKEMVEAGKKTDEKLDELAKIVKELSKNVGGLNGSMGELIETLFGPHICEKFDPYQFNLKRIFKRVPIYDDTSRRRGEIDLLLSNTTVCMVLEVKRWLDNLEKVNEHIKRMQLVSQYPPAEIKGKKLMGAIAGAVVTPEAREYAEESGFFVLELAGDDVQLLESPEDFQAKEW